MVGATAMQIFLPAAIQQAVDTIRMMGSSSLVMTPTQGDFANPELRDILPRYLRGASVGAEERVAIMKMAWDVSSEQFASRSMLYEYFFAGDPINNRILRYSTGTNKDCTAMAQGLLDKVLKGSVH
jgi:aromatic ring hydroxylase